MQTQGTVKTIVRRLGQKVLDRETSAMAAAGKDNVREDLEGRAQTSKGKDILSVLLRSRRLCKDTSEQLTDEQVLDNVRL